MVMGMKGACCVAFQPRVGFQCARVCVAMVAADKRTKAKVQGAIHVKTARINLADLSVQSDSGWRELSDIRVVELEAVILAGDFGNTTLTRPTVLCDQGDQVHTAGAGKRNPLG